MSSHRRISEGEKRVIAALLQLRPELKHFIGALDDLYVQNMDDGGMGSLLLIPEGTENLHRQFGRQIVNGQFIDRDGVQVCISINTDKEDRLYELDIWKVTFEPLVSLPNPTAITIAEQQP